MKKQIIITGFILAAGLILAGAGCGGQNAEQGTGQKEEQAPVNQVENGETTTDKINPGVTKEELNKLKSDLEETEYDDLNALTK